MNKTSTYYKVLACKIAFNNYLRINILVIVLLFNNIAFSQNTRIQAKDNSVPLAWAKLTLHIMKTTPGGSPTYGSRFLGYMGLTMAKSIEGNKKLFDNNSLNGFEAYQTSYSNRNVIDAIALNTAQATNLRNFYGFTNDQNLAKIDSLEELILRELSKKIKLKRISKSIDHGLLVANSIYEWSKLDGGHNAYLKNFDSSFVYPRGRGIWTPPVVGQAAVALPLHHTWGNNRTFSKLNQSLPIPNMITGDGDNANKYTAMMTEVYEKRQSLSQTEKEIANWWGDDPSETFSPPGHSYYMASIAVENGNADLYMASQTFAGVGMAVADAFINCWKCKYYYNAERPFSYIFHNINTLWDLYWPEPPFPAFYSGHAGQASSAATVLTSLYGENFAFVDMAHVGRPKDTQRLVEYKARKFNSFWEAAQESADSRLYGGIHTRQDNEVGLEEGKKIGKNILRIFI